MFGLRRVSYCLVQGNLECKQGLNGSLGYVLSGTVCLGSRYNYFYIFNFYVSIGVLLKGMVESSLLSEDERLTTKFDQVVAF